MGGCGSGRRFVFGARRTVESCESVDIREWLRTGYPISGTVSLTSTACNFGGERYWFECPGCSCRVTTLFRVGERFACRKCHGLNYRMQHENAYGRGLLKAQRIRMKLGGSANMTLPFPEKPKHMRCSYQANET